MRLLAGLILAGMLIGCGQANKAAPPQAEMVQDAMVAGEAQFASRDMGAQDQSAAPVDAPAPPPPSEPRPGVPPISGGTTSPVMYLAYAYQKTLELPADHLIGVMDAHIHACLQAGLRLCQLIGSSREGDPRSYISGSVSLRGEIGRAHV